MELFVNELSLHGQFGTIGPFADALKEVLRCRETAIRYTHRFYCLRKVADQEAVPGMTFKAAVQQFRDKDLTRSVMSWITKHGPFWEDNRQHRIDEWFEYEHNIVTDYSLGEATFRMAQAQATATLSFCESKFCINPLRVVWQQADNQRDEFDIPNFWDLSSLEAHLIESEKVPQSWPELIARARVRFSSLSFVDTILDPLVSEPFNTTIAQRIIDRLDILDRLKRSFDENATLTPAGHKLLQDFFHGDRALFTDESDTNKRTFKKQMTFTTPTGEQIFCPYHGKISFRYYRVHHSWPVRPDQPLYIAYIGPKITKD